MRLWTRPFYVTLAGLLIGAAALCVLFWPTTSNEHLLADARGALTERDFHRAEELAGRVLSRSQDSSSALLIAGEAATKLGRFDDALAYYARIPDNEGRDSFAGQFAMAELHRHIGGFLQAETIYRRLLRRQHETVLVQHRLVRLLNQSGRRLEAIPLLFGLLRRGRETDSELIFLGSVEVSVDASMLPDPGGLRDPLDPLILLRQAQEARRNHEPQRAARLLHKTIAAAPELIEPRVQLGWSLLESEDDERFLEWRTRLPRSARQRSDIWTLDGAWFQSHGDLPRAARFFWEAVRLSPNDRPANYRLSQVLAALGRNEDAPPFAARAAKLKELLDVLTLLTLNATPQEQLRLLRRVVRLTEALGRYWEARAWCQRALARNSRVRWARAAEKRVSRELEEDTPRTLRRANPAGKIDLSDFPLPEWEQTQQHSFPSSSLGTRTSRRAREIRVVFQDQADTAGIDFTYFNGGDPNTNINRMYEFTGGGGCRLGLRQ